MTENTPTPAAVEALACIMARVRWIAHEEDDSPEPPPSKDEMAYARAILSAGWRPPVPEAGREEQSYPERPICLVCSRLATCVGSYEGSGVAAPSCDVHCGHGNEDGRCYPIICAAPSPDALRQVREALQALRHRLALTAGKNGYSAAVRVALDKGAAALALLPEATP